MATKCPEGHDVGVRSTKAKGVCTPLFCARLPPNIRPPKTLEELHQKMPVETKAHTDDRELETTHVQRTRRELAKLKEDESERHAVLGVTAPLPTGADADAYMDRVITDARPLAALEMVHQLRFGNDAARKDAAKFILEDAGHGKKDGKSFGTAPVLMVFGEAPPWAQRVVKEAQKVVESLPSEEQASLKGEAGRDVIEQVEEADLA